MGRGVKSLLFFLLAGGFFFPSLLLLAGRLFFPWRSGGSLLYLDRGGRRELWGSALIAQAPPGKGWFHPRPSSAPPRILSAPPPPLEIWPEELYTFSASGLDPHLTLEGALYQVPRVSRETGIPEGELRELVRREARYRSGDGARLVSVTELNLELARRRGLWPGAGLRRSRPGR